MNEFPKNIKFKYNWRKYQKRVLNELQEHLTDQHLHVIAPPGSGKTILGLEVALRLNKPVLILVPTIAIQNQWIQRFCELFLQTNSTPNWISRNIRNPEFMTVVTYQGLHSACNDFNSKEKQIEEEEEFVANNEVINALKTKNIKTIIVDEAHHLKNEWWKTLTKVKEQLKPVIVGLTATPPYDVTYNEWNRYIELNGPVDSEISVPELIIEGNLCPHQDYVHFTLPTDEEHKIIIEFRENIKKVFNEIKQDVIIIKAIEQHPIWIEPTKHLNWIYKNLSFYSACLIFLYANKKEIPKIHLEIIGDSKIKIPELDYNWLETLLDFYLFQDEKHFTPFEEHQKIILNKLKRKGAIEKKRINLSHNNLITNSLKSSISKLNGIQKIVDFEHEQLGKNLRMVILSDYIRKEFFVNADENNLELTKIGIIPIFEKLRRENRNNKRIGVLTGSIIIIPKTAFKAFKTLAYQYGITKINSSQVPYDDNYILIHQSSQIKNDIINIVTEIFKNGEIEILIGTKSLLGEGWDAPAINTLILASFVGSFVLSNQMRGRAIRTQKDNLKKTSNIWHLATIDQTSENGGDDLDILKRRFKSFVGVSFKEEPSIENGIGRLNLPNNITFKEAIEKENSKMFLFSKDRKSLKKRWDTALESGITLIEEIKIPFSEKKEYRAVKSMYLNKTIANLIATLSSSLIGFTQTGLDLLNRISRHFNSVEQYYNFLIALGIVGVIIYGRFTFVTLHLYIKYRDISKDIQKIGDALLHSLIKAELLHTNNSELKVETTIDKWGAVYCHLEGGTTFEKSIFINALHEIVVPIENPRYVIIRKNKFMLFFSQKDYHSVPEILGRNKKLAQYFENQWKKLVGNCSLIFTRTIEGRKSLLEFRIKALSSQFQDKVDHVNKWR
ncbi:DEAD/DEAH box helicase family protein [Polaribacter vadi]|uniref:DEAD/DEAH box helicase family protein n=1 Tax=Polaribacter TaxID=52959 RepID=UPI001C0A5B7B|nr:MULTISPECIES: DEAD/DEAH box helicase family protein [Polaribacter]MBU3010559.1 DEAD/DEAH box helicase family protein [Polaribacter vadi]MDO6740370.1 DEAD/DEAH box helicase family protein [Polaribacter sp. 1_MG-2023]